MHKIVGIGNIESIKFLINQGVDINSIRVRGCTPLHQAALRLDEEVVVECLLKAGALVLI
ncbi:MAG: ankyrin repeat domain-containing protein [Rickettsia endosymbiont of Bryobia graminum]|nr:ankyrin repeat domain-containing protein [Rickettsia endosymbiont of Bryobia graminum]